MNDKDSGYVLKGETQTHRQALTFIKIVHVPINKRETIQKEKTEYVLLAKLAYMQRW